MIISIIVNATELIELKKESWALIYKHSSTCAFSSNAYTLLQNINFPGKAVIITVQTQRDLSNLIVHTFQIAHQTPQVIILQNGVVKATFSGANNISEFNIKNVLNT